MGVLYARESGAWVPVAGQGIGIPAGGTVDQVLTKASATNYDTVWATTPLPEPFIIRDPIGAEVPQIIFDTGDGNGAGITSRSVKIQLYANMLRFIDIGLNPNYVIGYFKAVSTTEAELTVGAWTWNSAADNYLRFHHGSDRATSEMFLDQNGGLGLRGGLSTGASANIAGWLTVPNVTLTSNYIYGSNVVIITGQGSPTCNLQVNASNGATHPIVYIASNPTGNNWNNRPLCVAKHSGAGEVAIGFVNHVTGYTAAIQLYSDGAYYFGAINGANNGYIKWLASAFQVTSSARFKSDVEPLSGARRLIERVGAVRYRDLQHELAIAASSEPVHNAVREPQPPVESLYRFGLIAEEVEEVAPELVMSSPHGPTLDLSGLVAVLWQAVKDLRAEVAALQSATP